MDENTVKTILQGIVEAIQYGDTEEEIENFIEDESIDINDVCDLQEAGYLTNETGFVITDKNGEKLIVTIRAN